MNRTIQRILFFSLKLDAVLVVLLLALFGLRLTLDFGRREHLIAAGLFLLFTAALAVYHFFVASADSECLPVTFPLHAVKTLAQTAAKAFALPFLLLAAARVASHFGYDPFDDWKVFLGAILALVIFWWGLTHAPGSSSTHQPSSTQFLRGTYLLTPDEAYRRGNELLATNGGPSIFWGGLFLPEPKISEGHFLVSGATGSGKTLTLRLLMQTVLPHIRERSDWRALVYDAKQDSHSLLSGMSLSCRVLTMNPFDARSVAWDMAKDITTPATALQVASILIPKEEGQNRFFSDAARDLLAGVFIAFMNVLPEKWTFRDVVVVMRDEKRLRILLEGFQATSHLTHQYLRDPRTSINIQSTIASHMAMLSPIAALWSRKKAISLTEWVDGNFVLVLGNDESLRAPLDAVNRVIFQRLTELVLAQSESKTRRSWFFLDEVKEAGRLDGLSRLITKGRSKGVRVVLGFQDIKGLREVYGENAADELAGMCSNKAILRLDSEATAAWGAQLIGEAEQIEITRSHTQARESSNTTTEQIQTRSAVLASQILRLSIPENGLFHGYYITPAIGVYPGRVFFRPLLLDPGKEPNFEKREPEEQYLPPWDGEDNERFPGFPDSGPSPAAKPKRGVLDIERLTLGDEPEQPPDPSLDDDVDP
ncbi:MAG: type IV secretion system DNA-binding domain-containing protein [Planctomycetes bacterium]|nr:type IV secretion system DNA-binding domain-containing protein [Planctomycetota bacterium]